MRAFGSQLLIGFDGLSSQDFPVKRVQQCLKDHLIGGVILFQKNIQSANQLQDLIQSFYEAAFPQIPFIAIDQEGGEVQRLKEFHNFPSAQQIADQYSPLEALEIYQEMARMVQTYGFNLNFGPVVDFAAHPTLGNFCPVIGGKKRSYGLTLETITAYAQAFIQAHGEYKICTALKHYPGHGLAAFDSHHQGVDITDSYDPLEEQPFYQLATQGWADMIMVAHLHHRHWDARYPASLSPAILKRLRSYYSGVLVSDDYHMGAIIDHFKLEEILTQSLTAGMDLLVFSNNPKASYGSPSFQDILGQIETLHQTVERLLTSGILNPSSLQESQERLLSCRHSKN